MLHYLVTHKKVGIIRPWIDYYARVLANEVTITAYRSLKQRVPQGTYIFSDIERLSLKGRARAAQIWEKLEKGGCRLLNHPQASLMRYALQKALSNDFRVFRAHEVPSGLKFPVFLRVENDHKGAMTPLLRDDSELQEAQQRFPTALVVEFLDTADSSGIYRKYAATRIGEVILPRHILFSRDWMTKKPDLVEPWMLVEEETYVRTNPHRDALHRIFDVARINYGRIDYALYNGKIQTWEINTHPQMATPESTKHAERKNLHVEVGEKINAAFLALSRQLSISDPLLINLGFWRMPLWN